MHLLRTMTWKASAQSVWYSRANPLAFPDSPRAELTFLPSANLTQLSRKDLTPRAEKKQHTRTSTATSLGPETKMSAYKPAKQFHSLARSLTGHVLSPAFDFNSDRFPIELSLFPADCHLFTQLLLWVSGAVAIVVLLLVRRGASLSSSHIVGWTSLSSRSVIRFMSL